MAEKVVILKKTLGERIKRLAGEKNISLSFLESQAGYSAGMITRWNNVSEKENFEIFSKLATIAVILDVSIDELLGMKEFCGKTVVPQEANLISCMTTSTKAAKLHWVETDWKSAEELPRLSASEEHASAISWLAERGRIQFLLTSYCDDLDDEKEPMSLQLYVLAGHGILPQLIQAESAALHALYMAIQIQAVQQSLANDTTVE